MSLERRLRRNRLRMGLIQTGDALTVLGRNFTRAACLHGAWTKGHEEGYEVGYDLGFVEGRDAAYSEVAGGAHQ